MANLCPFSALRYNPSKVNLKDVVTQPYDKITPAMQEKYYRRSPYNLVRVILGKTEPGDDATKNVYSRASESLREWRKAGVLTPDPEPSIYLYAQEFLAPGESHPRTRRGFIAAGQLHDYDERVVFRHEQTLSKPKSDRLNLLRATRTHAGQIFVLYNDPAKTIEPVFDDQGESLIDLVDDYGVRNQLWRISDPDRIAAVQSLMNDKKLIIADGHHRYETALSYRNERRATVPRADPNAAYERVMMTFVNTEDTGLVILPTHRVVHGLKSFSQSEFLKKIETVFTATEVNQTDPFPALAGNSRGTRLLAVTRDAALLLHPLPEKLSEHLSKFSAAQRGLDVLVLHKVLLEGVLGMTEESIRNQEHIDYVRDAGDAIERVRNGGAQIAFLMNPVSIEQMSDIALAGEVMPQKSTDFYPKLLSGLTFYSVE